MNVFWREIKANRKSVLVWAIGLSVLVVVFLSLYTAFSKDVEASRKILMGLPPAFRQAFNLSSANFFTIYGFFGYLFTFIGLAGAVQAMNYGVGVLSKEDSGKTADFLLSKSISRTKVIISKLAAVLALVLFTNLVFSAVALTTANIVSTDTFSSQTFLMISATLLLIQLFFVALGFLLSQIIPKIKSSITVALPTVFIFFFASVVAAIIGDTDIYYLTPFKYYSTDYIIAHSSYETKFLIIEAVFFVVALVASYIIFVKKDIKAAS